MKSKVTNKIINLSMLSLLVMNILTACGEEPMTTPEADQGVQDQQAADPRQTQATQPAQATQSAATKTTVKPATSTTTVANPAATGATATPTVATNTPSTAAASNASIGLKLITKSKQVYDALRNYSATITMYSKRNDKVSPTANPVINMEFKYVFAPPRKALFNVVKHNISMVIGAKMLWEGGETAKVKASGVLGLFPIDMKLADPKMSTNREWKLSDLDHVSILNRALDSKATVELAGKTTANGKEAYMIKVKNVGLDSDIVEENIALDAKTFMILADEMYSKDELIFQLKMTVEATNSALAADIYEL